MFSITSNLFVWCCFLEEEKAKKDPKYYLNRANKDTLGILSELEKTYKEPVSPADIRDYGQFLTCPPYVYWGALRISFPGHKIVMTKKLIRKTNTNRFQGFNDVLSSLSRKWRNLSSLVFLINLVTKDKEILFDKPGNEKYTI